jgi:hypothetical protein
VQSAEDVAQAPVRSGAFAPAAAGRAWWSPSTGLAFWAGPVPALRGDQLGYRAWLATDDGARDLGPVARDERATLTATFDVPRDSATPVRRVFVTIQPIDRNDRPSDSVAFDIRF